MLGTERKEYDAFLSHAIEDKISIANELYQKLKDKGLKIWYSSNFQIGASISSEITKGLKGSKYGIVILSPNYISKQWTMDELEAMQAMQSKHKIEILQVRHQITNDEVLDCCPTLASKWNIPSEKGIANVVEQLYAKITKTIAVEVKESMFTKVKRVIKKRLVFLVTLIIAGIAIAYSIFNSNKPDGNLISQSIEKRIEDFQNKINRDLEAKISQYNGVETTIAELTTYFIEFNEIESKYRNYYEYDNGYEDREFKKNLDGLGIDLSTNSPINAFGFSDYKGHLIYRRVGEPEYELYYAITNEMPLHREIVNKLLVNDITYEVTVSYTNNIRFIASELTYSEKSKFFRTNQMTYLGFKPKEVYVFINDGDQWLWDGVE